MSCSPRRPGRRPRPAPRSGPRIRTRRTPRTSPSRPQAWWGSRTRRPTASPGSRILMTDRRPGTSGDPSSPRQRWPTRSTPDLGWARPGPPTWRATPAPKLGRSKMSSSQLPPPHRSRWPHRSRSRPGGDPSVRARRIRMARGLRLVNEQDEDLSQRNASAVGKSVRGIHPFMISRPLSSGVAILYDEM